MKQKMEHYRGKILVINDVPRDKGRISKLLKEQGYRCTFVSNVDEANDLEKHENFDATMYSKEFDFSQKLH
ncbi:hypothetical protein ACFLUO_05720 [Chloroflexota bacterium]